MRGKHIFVGVSGSIAAYKAAELVRQLIKAGATVQVGMTESACKFIQPMTFEALTGRPVMTDLFALRGEIGHVERAHEADVCVVAPATASTIARLRAGIADDPVTATCLATTSPIVIAPAMETGMWLNPATRDNIAMLVSRGYTVVDPEEGDLASGRTGVGRLAEIDRIVNAVENALIKGDFSGVRITVTAGPTYEPIDPVRVLSNRSTGAMGIAIALAAHRRGAHVRLILGPTHLPPPNGVETTRVETAHDMLAAGEALIASTDVLIATAAVSDFRPKAPKSAKLKRSEEGADRLELTENPDILTTLAAKKSDSAIIVGFAAETEALEANARQKLEKKGCDLVIANRVGPKIGFGNGQTSVSAVFAEKTVSFGPASKKAVADFVLDQILSLRTQAKDA